ncbi:MAG: type II toxin-antitoxin system VapC family toxin [Chloroflexota bacterium]|nr:type II toxin-antitoxin system VapC family toxin [Chloroflexota bacterium]
MNYLIDTCVISELVSKQPNPNVVDWVDSLESEQVYLSVITIGEITKGIEKLPESECKRDLQNWLDHDLLPRFHDRILPLDTDVLIQWGSLLARLEAGGTPMPAIDSLIAATVLTHAMTLVTRNVSDFESSGVEMINPWG